MERNEREQLIAQYADGYRMVSEALLKITPEELDAKPSASAWSPREIVHHLADSEMTAAVRLRRLLAEDRPAILGYDQDQYAHRLHYDRPYEADLDFFRTVRASTAQLLGCLSEAEWLREGTHSEVGRYGVDTWLRIYAAHAHRHADQIRAARGAVNKAGAAQ